jgi:capsular exopolysaccharide synthesis family protein
MELSAYLEILNRRKWIIIIATMVTMAVFYFVISRTPPTYQTTTVLRIVPYTSNNPSYTQLIYAERIMNTYVEIASSTRLLEELREELSLNDDQPKEIRVEVIPDTELLLITVEDYDPILARETANTMASIILGENTIRDIRVYVVEPAISPEPPSPYDIFLYFVLALSIGLVGGVGLAFLVENLDTRLHTSAQIEGVTGLPVLVKIPPYRSLRGIIFLVDTAPYADIFRRLRVNILSLSKEKPFHTLLITSAEPNEGKSTIVSNLARSMAQTGRSIVIVDGDLHCPTIHTYFNLRNEVGLSSLLENEEILTDVLMDSQFKNLKVLTSGPTNTNSAELLDSEQMIATIEKLKSQFDLVLIDSPAFLGIADTAILAPYADGVILVARRGSVKEDEIRTTCQQLMNVQANLIGVVVNYANKTIPRSYYKYYHQPGQEEVSEDISPDMDEREIDARPESQEFVGEGVSFTRDEIADVGDAPRIDRDTSDDRDSLKVIDGIGPAYEEALYSIGIMKYKQLAAQSPEDLAGRLDGQINTQLIRQQRWIEQAQELCDSQDGAENH